MVAKNIWSKFKKPFEKAEKELEKDVKKVEETVTQTAKDVLTYDVGDALGIEISQRELLEGQLGVLGVAFGGGLGGTALAGVLAEEGIVGLGAELGGVEGGIAEISGLDSIIGNAKKILGGIGKVGAVGLGIEEILKLIDKFGNTNDASDKIGHLRDIIDKANQIAEENSDEEIEVLSKISDALAGLSEIVRTVNQGTHHDIKDFIDENQGEINAIRHTDLVIQEGLAELEKEEKQEVDALVRIATTLDKPVNINDMMTDLSKFESIKAKTDFVIENYNTFIGLPPQDKSNILELLLEQGGLEVVAI